jgi:tetratricopeptide (TPR) repeat protein
MRTLFFVAAIVLSVGLLAGAQDAGALIEDAEALYDRWGGSFDFDAYRTQLEGAIDLYKQALDALPPESLASRTVVLNRLARATFELATAYLVSADAKEDAFAAGKEYALASLRLDPAFVDTESGSFREALSEATDVDAVFWYGTNLGSYLNYHQVEAIVGGGMRDIPVCYERTIELDPTYLAGAGYRSLASFYAQVPGFLGGDLDKARDAYEQAIEIDASFLENAVSLAEYVYVAQDNYFTACTVLRDVEVKAADTEIMALWPLYNTLAAERARGLIDDHGCP